MNRNIDDIIKEALSIIPLRDREKMTVSDHKGNELAEIAVNVDIDGIRIAVMWL